ncbi:uncharacterized protein N7458_012496 [Penicillium daleae]|uniref:Uncharacterized protein n=1 Tax=Penicillium daleae TaxID=63821 RepID=A0AAD6BVF7_9EURO|nr:uncharacterized protein N7458_012496 [Penicillium daleae]KAJ5433340.1 hypothetical protein N7458_012496 [Penicillium daleae]
MGQDPDKSTGASTGLGACHISSKLHDGTGRRADRTPAKTMRQQVWNYGAAVGHGTKELWGCGGTNPAAQRADAVRTPLLQTTHDPTVDILTFAGLSKTGGPIEVCMADLQRFVQDSDSFAHTGYRGAEHGAEPWAPGF